MTTVYQLLGIDFAPHKLQSGQDLVILGIVCDLKFEPERREKLLVPMEDILPTMPQPRLLFNPFTAAPIEIVKRGSTRPTSFLLITRHLFQGYNSIEDFGDLLGCSWKTAKEHDLAVYVYRIPTDS